MDILHDEYVYIECRKEIYRLSKAGDLSNKQLKNTLHHMATPHTILITAYGSTTHVPSPSALSSTPSV